METNLLFVYGSLLKKGVNHHLLQEQGAKLFSKEAFAKGKLYQIDWYPGYVEGSEGQVLGEVYQFNNINDAIPSLDEYEGPEYKRKIISVTASSNAINCWVYIYIDSIKNAIEIPNGDFISFINS